MPSETVLICSYRAGRCNSEEVLDLFFFLRVLSDDLGSARVPGERSSSHCKMGTTWWDLSFPPERGLESRRLLGRSIQDVHRRLGGGSQNNGDQQLGLRQAEAPAPQ